jgi:hypothetical protein
MLSAVIKTFSITILRITTLSIKVQRYTLCKINVMLSVTFNIMKLRILTLRIKVQRRSCNIFIKLNVIMASVVMPRVVAPL